MRVLIVEDNASLLADLSASMRGLEHAVDTAVDGEMADDMLAAQSFDLVILDLNLPALDGLEVLRRYRERGGRAPVLILSARSGTENRVRGLDLGADDYLAKPFDLEELEARTRALLRRGGVRHNPEISIGPLRLDTVSRTVWLNDVPLALTPRERNVLEVLMRNPDVVVSKDRIIEHLFSFGEEVSAAAIELYVHRLRKKITDPGVSINTIRGLGYLLQA
ncbi:MAG: response regulator transcription factor [Hyphomicrobiaceae bacterium]|nr:response regulator transcription factor [Hyphomicrobiaceae bacterium]